MDLGAFYAAFSPACFALLGLWLVAVQLRLPEWQADPDRERRVHRLRRSYGIALFFALPGMMSVLALVDEQTHLFWRISFIVVGLSGAVVLALVWGLPVPRVRDRSGQRHLPGTDRLALAAYTGAIILYLLIGALAAVGGQNELRTEAVLQTVLIFLGFNAAWLLLLDDRNPSRRRAAPHESAPSTP